MIYYAPSKTHTDPMKTPPGKKQLNVTLDAAEVAAAKRTAEDYGLSVNQLIRRALDFVRRHRPDLGLAPRN